MTEALQGVLALLMTLGPMALCFGIPCLGFILLFVGILIWGSRQYGVLTRTVRTAQAVTISQLKAGMGIVRLRGVIRQVSQPLWLSGTPPLAMLYLQINGRKFDGEYAGLQGKLESSPFLLDDGTGAIWIDPHPVDKRLLLPPTQPTPAQIEDACAALKIDHDALLRTSYPQQYQLWQWKEGDSLTVIGPVVALPERVSIGRVKEAPMLVTQMDDAQLAEHVHKSSGKMRTVTIVMAAILGFLLLAVIGAVVFGLGRVFLESFQGI